MKRTRKILALLLSICMIVTMLPTVAFAAAISTAGITSLSVCGQSVSEIDGQGSATDPYTATVYVDNYSEQKVTLQSSNESATLKYAVNNDAKTKPDISNNIDLTSGSVTDGSISSLNDSTKVLWLEYDPDGGDASNAKYFAITVKQYATGSVSAELQGGTLTQGTDAGEAQIKLTASGLNFVQSPSSTDFTLEGAGSNNLSVNTSVTRNSETEVILDIDGTPSASGEVKVKIAAKAFDPQPKQEVEATGSITVAVKAPTITLSTQSTLTAGTEGGQIVLTSAGGNFANSPDKSKFTLESDQKGTLDVSSVASEGNNTATLTMSGTATGAGTLTIKVAADAFNPEAAAEATATVTINAAAEKPTGTITAALEEGTLTQNTAVSTQKIKLTISSGTVQFKSAIQAENFQLDGAGKEGLRIDSVSRTSETVAELTLGGTPTAIGAVTVKALKSAFETEPEADITASGDITVAAEKKAELTALTVNDDVAVNGQLTPKQDSGSPAALTATLPKHAEDFTITATFINEGATAKYSTTSATEAKSNGTELTSGTKSSAITAGDKASIDVYICVENGDVESYYQLTVTNPEKTATPTTANATVTAEKGNESAKITLNSSAYNGTSVTVNVYNADGTEEIESGVTAAYDKAQNIVTLTFEPAISIETKYQISVIEDDKEESDKLPITVKPISSNANIKDIIIAKSTATKSTGSNDGKSVDSPIEYTVTIPGDANLTDPGVDVIVNVADPTATVKYSTNDQTGTWSGSDTLTGDTNTAEKKATGVKTITDKIWFEVTAQDDSTLYYKVTVEQSNITADTPKVEPDLGDYDGDLGSLNLGIDLTVNMKDALDALTVDLYESKEYNNDSDLKKQLQSVQGTSYNGSDPVHVRVVTTVDVAVREYNKDATFKLEIEPTYQVVVTTETNKSAALSSIPNEYAVLDTGTVETAGTDVEVVIPVPSDFATNPDYVSVKHIHGNGKVYYYLVQVNSGKITFTNSNGFSEFDLTKETSAKLTNLTVSEGTLTPDFSPDTDTYTVNVANSVEEIDVTATTSASSPTFTPQLNDAGSYSMTNGNPLTFSGLQVGTNKITIKVESGSLTAKTYTINVIRAAAVSDRPSSGTAPSTTYPVTSPTQPVNGKVSVSPQNAKQGETVTVTATPDEDYAVDKVVVKDKDGKEVAVTKNADGTYSFKMPASEVTIDVTFKDSICKSDVDTTKWYHPYVHYVLKNGIMTGTPGDKFSPDMTLSRAMVAQSLYAGNKKPAVASITTKFPDVKPDNWFAQAVTWATENGAVSGYDNGDFGPNDNVTREQLAVMLYGAYGKPAVTGNQLGTFSDSSSVSSWAQTAMLWAVQNGVLSGNEKNQLNPQGNASRAEAATMLKAYFELK